MVTGLTAMGPDDDLARLLPEAPPRPSRREAAIAEALSRFDGAVPSATTPPRQPAFAWPKIGRASLGALVSVALLAVIGVPLALKTVQTRNLGTTDQESASAEKNDFLPADPLRTPPASQSDRSKPRDEKTQRVPTPADKPPSGFVESVARKESRQPASQVSAPQEMAMVAPAMSTPPPPLPARDDVAARSAALPAAPGVRSAESDQQVTVTSSRAAPSGDGVASAIATAKTTAATSIVVTGSRITRAGNRAAQRGDWNACTVNDPDHSLDRCSRVVNPGAKGVTGQAAARIADGLMRAWEGDMTGAVTAFDAAIGINPRDAFAYLNRGLAYQRLGDTDRAIKDFDQVIRHAPDDARGFYHRSIAFHTIGNARRASRDEIQAIKLDVRYRELFN